MPLERHFLNWDQPALPAAADYLIGRYASADQLDLSQVILVFPGRRAARRMLEILIQKAGSRWPGLIPPRMVTFQQFPEMLYRQQRKLADDLTQLLVWKQAICSIPAREIRAALPVIPPEEALSSWLSLCETLRRQHDELAADGMEFDEVFSALARTQRTAEADRWKALRRIQSEYLVRMDDLSLWDRQAARLVAVQLKECATDCDILLVGTVDMNRIVQQMLDQVADRVTALIHAPESEAESFDQYGCLVPEVWAERRVNIAPEMTRIVDTSLDQGMTVVSELKSLQGRFRADDITIGIGSDTVVPAILQSLADHGISGRWSVEMYVSNSRPYRLLESIAKHLTSARDGQPADFATLSLLVRHPDVFDWVDREMSRAGRSSSGKYWLTVLDQYLSDHLQTAPGVLLGDLTVRSTVGGICSAIEKLLQQLLPHQLRPESPGAAAKKRPSRPSSTRQRQLLLDSNDQAGPRDIRAMLDTRRSLLFWAEGCLRLLSSVYGDRELQIDSAVDRGIVTCFQAIQQAVESLQQMPDSVMPQLSAGQALQFLLRQIAAEVVTPDQNEQAIELLGWLELSLDDAPVLILTGFNEGAIPESVTSDVFLPNSFRSELGLTDNQRRYARDAYAMTAILASRRRATLIAARSDHQNNPLSPSRLWFAADPLTIPQRVRLFYQAEADKGLNASVDSDEDAALPAVSESRISRFSVPVPVNFEKVPQEISVSAFREYLFCPYRYFLNRELHLKSVEDESRELTATAFGSLMHDVLNRFGQSAVRDSTTPEAIEVFLLNELRKLAVHQFGRDRSATVSVQLRMLENRLQGFAQWQARTAAEGWRIRHTETELKYKDFRDIRERPVTLKGRVDRIDENLNSRQWRVLDYKTSESAEKPESTHRRKDEWQDLQLPLYRLLVRSLGIETDVELGYVHLPGDLSRIGCSIASWDQADLDSAEHQARVIAADILDLKIDRVARGDEMRSREFARLCQDTVIDRNISWLAEWTGRRAD
jgi:ATP-dependent helicase/nuclease subunit B